MHPRSGGRRRLGRNLVRRSGRRDGWSLFGLLGRIAVGFSHGLRWRVGGRLRDLGETFHGDSLALNLASGLPEYHRTDGSGQGWPRRSPPWPWVPGRAPPQWSQRATNGHKSHPARRSRGAAGTRVSCPAATRACPETRPRRGQPHAPGDEKGARKPARGVRYRDLVPAGPDDPSRVAGASASASASAPPPAGARCGQRRAGSSGPAERANPPLDASRLNMILARTVGHCSAKSLGTLRNGPLSHLAPSH